MRFRIATTPAAGMSCSVSLFEIKAEIPINAVDDADGTLLELENPGWTVVEDVIAGKAWIVGIFATESEALSRWNELLALLPGLLPGVPAGRALLDEEWRDSYKRHFHAWKFGRLNWVPVWEKEQFIVPPGEAVLWLDPGLAFGTGNHETTRLCVERLVELVQDKGSIETVVDVGCGSGILALSAAKLGCRRVSGFDNDPEAVRVSDENATLNGLGGIVTFYQGDLATGLAGISAELVFANILADVLMRFARELTGAVAPSGRLVLSGILAKECEQVRAVFASIIPAWSVESRTMGEWSDVLLCRPPEATRRNERMR